MHKRSNTPFASPLSFYVCLGLQLQTFEQPKGTAGRQWIRIFLFAHERCMTEAHHDGSSRVKRSGNCEVSCTAMRRATFFVFLCDWRYSGPHEREIRRFRCWHWSSLAGRRRPSAPRRPGRSCQSAWLHSPAPLCGATTFRKPRGPNHRVHVATLKTVANVLTCPVRSN